jgi:cytochrome d ubiquinol oxidase subunit II
MPADAPLALLSLAEVPMLLILVGLAAYIVLAGADFGAPLWAALARGEDAAEIREHSHAAMGPVWEANHVWLIFVLVVCWTAYPVAFGSIASTLAVPLLIAAIGIIIRGTSYVLRGEEDSPAVTAAFALSSVLTPFALGAAIGAIASGQVPVGNAAGDEFGSWTGATSITIGALAVAFCAYLSAVYMAGDAARQGSARLADAFRSRGLAAGLIAGVLALAGLIVLRSDATRIYDGLTSGAGLAAVLVSAAAGAAALWLLWARRYEAARYSAALAVAATVAGWGIAQSPVFLPGLTIEQAAAGHSTLVALLVSIAAGLVVLVPSLVLLFGLVLRGRFDPGAAASAGEEGAASGAPRLRLAVPIVLGTAGAVLTVASDGGVTLALGVLAMLGFIVTGFLALAGEGDVRPSSSVE